MLKGSSAPTGTCAATLTLTDAGIKARGKTFDGVSTQATNLTLEFLRGQSEGPLSPGMNYAELAIGVISRSNIVVSNQRNVATGDQHNSAP